MFSRIRTHFGTAGLVVAIMALVVALTGSAIAANYIITSKNQIKPSVLKTLKGPKGPKGAKGAKGDKGDAGAAGAAGVAGAPGAPGAKGATGSQGAAGSTGATGLKGATGTTGVTGTTGTTGSTGTTGATGPTGAPWPAGGTLPSLATETGAWAASAGAELEPGEFTGAGAITYSIPLAAEIASANTKIVTGAAPADCENATHAGTASADNPEAKPGFLCVYVQAVLLGGSVSGVYKAGGAVGNPGDAGSSVSGAVAVVESTESGDIAYGTYAVTAP